MTLHRRLSARTRNAVLMLGCVAVFLTVGVPRFLAGDVGPGPTHEASGFARLCREHGGTLRAEAGTSGTKTERFCTVRYGSRLYRMDAITAAGFDADTARFQRQGCVAANQEHKGRGGRPAYVYHPETGVCERRF